jgi:hypothetical protein
MKANELDTYFTAYNLTKASRRELMKHFPPKFNLVAHHVTVEFDVPEDTPVPGYAELKVVGYASDDTLEALVVSVNGTTTRKDGSTYHLTWSKTSDRSSAESNAVIAQNGWTKVGPFDMWATPFAGPLHRR